VISIKQLRRAELGTLVLGNHPGIVQSMLDFDFLAGKAEPSVKGIITAGAKTQKLFWGNSEVLLPCFSNISDIPVAAKKTINVFINLNSARRVEASTREFFKHFPKAYGGHIFAEDVPEIAALSLYRRYGREHFIVGPSGVGLLIAGHYKLGAIGGTDYRQLLKSKLLSPGNTAVVSASGGMINEIIRMVANQNQSVSFALTVGGDRFPITTPQEALLAAQADPATESVLYYGELGGFDEYEIVDLVKAGKLTKPVVAYIAGTIAQEFATPVQFGHAKALAARPDESASAKRQALAAVGVQVADSIESFHTLIGKMKKPSAKKPVNNAKIEDLAGRSHSLMSSKISGEAGGEYQFVGKSLTNWEARSDFIDMVLAGLLGRPAKSRLLKDFTASVFKLGLDHGPEVSGAINTIVTARAGRDMVSALSAGLLTIGPRFGGAGNEAASNWFSGVQSGAMAAEFVEGFAKAKQLIAGIGHKKYRLGYPDPRVKRLGAHVSKLKAHPYLDFARAVEKITTSKKGNLILNFDGAFAAILLDILACEEKLTPPQIKGLIDAEFFNAFFIIPRSVGFISHFLDQKRLDEGLFRMPERLIHTE